MDSSAGLIGSSLNALTKRYRTVTHNLANSNTVGFKKRRSMFAQALAIADAQNNPTQASGEKIKETSAIDFTQGAMEHSGNPLDMAISGDGFFVIERPDGPPLYTRNGAFHINQQRQLVDVSNRPVAGKGGPIVLPSGTSPSQIHVSGDGKITVNKQPIGQVKIVTFKDKSALQSVGNNCFAVPQDTETILATKARVQQGFREMSNVSVVEELVDLISVTRLYEANLKNINSQDDRMKTILQVAMG